MNTGKVYLKQNVLMQPLFNQWYAWSNLISPVTAPMYIANLHLKVMQSFVSTPQVHMSAVKNPAMLGGPFMNYDASRVPDIKDLLDRTIKTQGHLIKFAEAVQSLDKMLSAEADGASLEPFYPRVPDILRGYVELVYDLNNHPSMRFIENLLYKSPYYCESSQSVALSLVTDDSRPFVFSTPWLAGEGWLQLNMPFKDERLDYLFKMRATPQPYEEVRELFQIGPEDEETFATFFTDEAPKTAERYTGDSVRIRYFGHACILFETKDVSILIDPVISYRYDNGIDRYTFSELPETIDYVLITHNHQDHAMFETLIQLRHKIKNLVVPRSNSGSLMDPSLRVLLQNIGFKNVREIDEMETIEVADGSILGLPFLGEHADLNIRTKMAHLVQLKGKSVLCAADSNNIEPRLYEHIHDAVGDVDTVFIGMECDGAPMSWLYGPLLTKPLVRKMDQSRRFDGSNCEKAIDLVTKLHARAVYVYAMGQEPWLTFLTSIKYTPESRPIVESDKLVEYCRSQNLPSERLFGCKELSFASQAAMA